MHSQPVMGSQSNPNLESSQEALSHGGCEEITVSRSEWLQSRWAAGYWKSLFSRVKRREAELVLENERLRQENRGLLKLARELGQKSKELERLWDERLRQKQTECEELQSRNASLTKMLFGRKSERASRPGSAVRAGSDSKGSGSASRRPSSGSVTRRRHDYSHLPLVEEQVEVSASQCASCGRPYVSNGYEESELVEIEVKAYRRKIRRERKRRVCDCSGAREIVAGKEVRLFAHTRYGLSVWVNYFYQRFGLQHTVGSFCRWSESVGVALNRSTLVNHNDSLLQLFVGFPAAIVSHLREALVVHADETGWPVQQAGVTNGEHYRGWLWTVLSEDAMLVVDCNLKLTHF